MNRQPTPSDFAAASTALDRWDAAAGDNDASWAALAGIIRLGGWEGFPQWLAGGDPSSGADRADDPWRWWALLARLAVENERPELSVRVFLLVYLLLASHQKSFTPAEFARSGLSKPQHQTVRAIALEGQRALNLLPSDLVLYEGPRGRVDVTSARELVGDILGEQPPPEVESGTEAPSGHSSLQPGVRELRSVDDSDPSGRLARAAAALRGVSSRVAEASTRFASTPKGQAAVNQIRTAVRGGVAAGVRSFVARSVALGVGLVGLLVVVGGIASPGPWWAVVMLVGLVAVVGVAIGLYVSLQRAALSALTTAVREAALGRAVADGVLAVVPFTGLVSTDRPAIISAVAAIRSATDRSLPVFGFLRWLGAPVLTRVSELVVAELQALPDAQVTPAGVAQLLGRNLDERLVGAVAQRLSRTSTALFCAFALVAVALGALVRLVA